MIYSKNTVFVAVKCQRLTMFLNIFTGSKHVVGFESQWNENVR
jgi:hypothetical protein